MGSDDDWAPPVLTLFETPAAAAAATHATSLGLYLVRGPSSRAQTDSDGVTARVDRARCHLKYAISWKDEATAAVSSLPPLPLPPLDTRDDAWSPVGGARLRTAAVLPQVFGSSVDVRELTWDTPCWYACTDPRLSACLQHCLNVSRLQKKGDRRGVVITRVFLYAPDAYPRLHAAYAAEREALEASLRARNRHAFAPLDVSTSTTWETLAIEDDSVVGLPNPLNELLVIRGADAPEICGVFGATAGSWTRDRHRYAHELTGVRVTDAMQFGGHKHDSALGYCVRPPALMLFRALLGDTADASAVALHATLDARYFTVRAERLLPYALCQVEVAPECDC